MILYIENPKDATRKSLELINEYSKVAGYKINTQKSLAFLYTNKDKTEREIKICMIYVILYHLSHQGRPIYMVACINSSLLFIAS